MGVRATLKKLPTTSSRWCSTGGTEADGRRRQELADCDEEGRPLLSALSEFVGEV
jgi:hypothetical protein